MKTSLMSLIAFVAAVLLMAGTQGCYTQVGSTRDEQVYDNEQAGNEAPADSEAGEEGEYDENAAQPPADVGQDWTCQMHMGFDYYYPNTWWPSVGFSFAYNDPWYGWGSPYYGYGYGYGYGYPYYGYGYPYYPYYPWYDPYYGYPGYWYPTDPVPWQNREFGATRGSGSTRGPRGVNASNSDMRGGGVNDPQMMDLQSGSGRSVVGGTAGGAAALKRGSTGATTQEPSSRSKGTSRKDVTRKMEQKLSPGQRTARSSRDNSRLYRDRSSVSGSGRSRSNDSGPALNSAPPSGGASSRGGTGSSGGSSAPRNGGSSVRSAPPPSSAPAARPSSPPPSSGGSRGGGGGGGGRSPRP